MMGNILKVPIQFWNIHKLNASVRIYVGSYGIHSTIQDSKCIRSPLRGRFYGAKHQSSPPEARFVDEWC